MRIRRVLSGVAAGAVLFTGMVVTAAPSNAALCGYPPVECPAGDTNPPTAQPIGGTPSEQAQAGMTLPSEETAQNTGPTAVPKPAVNAIGEAPKIAATKGEAVKLAVVVPSGVTYNVKVKRNDGVYNFVGTVVGRPGRAKLPTIQFDKNGTYTFALQAPDGDTYYVRVVVG